MKTTKNWLDIALRGTVFVYIPIAVLLYGSYRSIFSMNPGIHWLFIVLYLFVFLRWLIDKYRHQSIEEELQSFEGLDRLIERGRFEVLDKRQTEMRVRPTFDVPFNFILNDRIVLYYSNNTVRIEGPKHYIKILTKNILGEDSLWTRKSVSSLKFIYIGLLATIPVITESNLVWSMEVLRHNTFSSVSEEVEAVSENDNGNSLENALNGGQAVETEDYIIYIEDHMNLVRTDKQFENKKYLIQRDGGDSFGNLNVVGDWLYFTRGENLERMKVDGSDHSTLYTLSYLSEMQIKGDWIYFLSWKDDFNVYRMDLNGQNLEQLIDVRANSFTLHESRLLVSYENRDRVESYDLDGEDPQVVMNAYVDDLMVWDGYYYYLGEDNGLYRSETGGDSEPELIKDDQVSAYLVTEQGIFYSLHARDGIFMMTLEGEEDMLLSASERVHGLARVGDSILFSTGGAHGETYLKRFDMEVGGFDVMD